MKVLFAMRKDSVSKSISDMYYERYGEVLEYKNVFFFKALIEEVKNNKTYDRIVIDEDLEEYRTKDIEQLDNALFNNIDKITDEISDAEIILVCTDRREKGDPFINKLFSIGIYNLLLGDDRNINPLCDIIRKPKTKKEAKEYLKIDTSLIGSNSMTRDEEVEEAQMISIFKYYEGIKNQPEKYVPTFDEIAKQYSRVQLKIILSYLPSEVRAAVLKEDRYKYLALDDVNANAYTTVAGATPVVPKQQITGTAPNNNVKTNSVPQKTGGIFGTLKNRLAKGKLANNEEVDSTTKNAEKERIEKEKAEKEAREKALKEAEEQKRIEEERRQKELAEKAKKEQAELEEKAKREQAELEEKAKLEAKARAEVAEKAQKEQEERESAQKAQEEKNKIQEQIENEKKEQAELEERAKKEAEARAKLQEEARLRREAEEKKRMEDEKRAKEEQEKLAEEQRKIKEAQEKLEEEKRRLKEEQEKLINEQNKLRESANNFTSIPQYANNAVNSVSTSAMRMVALVGANKAGTTFLTNAIAHSLASAKIKTSIVDMTRDKSMFWLYNQNDKGMRKKAAECMQRVSDGEDIYLETNSAYLKVYTTLPGAVSDVRRSFKHKTIIDTVKNNCDVVIVDADFSTPIDYFEQADAIFIVQDLDLLKMPDTTSFLRELKNRGMNMKKIRILINKYVKTALTPKQIIQSLSYYTDPAMSFVDELLPSKVDFSVIPYNLNNYAKYTDAVRAGVITFKGYSDDFVHAIDEIRMLISSKDSGKSSRKLFG